MAEGRPIHLSEELFMQATGTYIIHVPYKGMGLAYADTLAGAVEIGFPTVVSSVAHLRSNRLRALAVTTPARAPSFPELSTMAEAGVPGMVVTNWYGIHRAGFHPARNRGAAEPRDRGRGGYPEMAMRLLADGSEAIGSTPEEFRAVITADRDK